jgi:hypothetical protein
VIDDLVRRNTSLVGIIRDYVSLVSRLAFLLISVVIGSAHVGGIADMELKMRLTLLCKVGIRLGLGGKYNQHEYD